MSNGCELCIEYCFFAVSNSKLQKHIQITVRSCKVIVLNSYYIQNKRYRNPRRSLLCKLLRLSQSVSRSYDKVFFTFHSLSKL